MKKTILSPVLTHLTYILGPKDSFCAFYLYYWSEIMPSYYPFQFPEKLKKTSKNLVLGQILVCLTQIWSLNFFFLARQFNTKLIKQTWENGKKPNFSLNFGPNLGQKTFVMGFTSTRCSKLFPVIFIWNFKKN